jgi:hypothetical protein
MGLAVEGLLRSPWPWVDQGGGPVGAAAPRRWPVRPAWAGSPARPGGAGQRARRPTSACRHLWPVGPLPVGHNPAGLHG